MRRIQKKEKLEILDRFKKDFKIKNGVDARYNDFRKSGKYHDIKEILIEEQYGLCCYCTNKIDDYNSHIEHFIPQSLDYTKDLEYSNMIVSCDGYKGNRNNCGHKKEDYYEEKIISPLEINCEENFKYLINGEITSDITNVRAKKTIEVLNLDSYLLNRARRSAIYTSGIFEKDFDEQKEQLIEIFETPENGRLKPFSPVILYCIKHI